MSEDADIASSHDVRTIAFVSDGELRIAVAGWEGQGAFISLLFFFLSIFWIRSRYLQTRNEFRKAHRRQVLIQPRWSLPHLPRFRHHAFLHPRLSFEYMLDRRSVGISLILVETLCNRYRTPLSYPRRLDVGFPIGLA